MLQALALPVGEVGVLALLSGVVLVSVSGWWMRLSGLIGVVLRGVWGGARRCSGWTVR